MFKKLFILISVITLILVGTNCTAPPECDDFGVAVESLYEEIIDVPNLNNPALFVHLEKAAVAGMEGDLETASKELSKFMNIGSQPKYEEIFQLFLDVETTFWVCLNAYLE